MSSILLGISDLDWNRLLLILINIFLSILDPVGLKTKPSAVNQINLKEETANRKIQVQ